MENAHQQFNRKIGIERHSGFLVNAKRGVPFHHKEVAELFVSKLRHGLDEIVDRLALLTGQGKNRVAAEFGQTAAELRLKNHDESDREENGKAAHQPADHDQVQQR